ncbi:putative Actin family, ATPase, nucleotide binding domain-containing protein [Helianthus anomalus]
MQSFMQIYGQRAQVPGAIIIDGGSGYCKFGWSKYDSPSGRAATFLEFGNIESPMYSRFRHFFATIYSRCSSLSTVKSTSQPTVVSIPITQYGNTQEDKTARRKLKEAIYSELFDMNVPSVCAVSQATLALFAARRTSGILVNIGFNQTSVVPILHGKIMHQVGVEVLGVGALKLTGYLREQMHQRNLNFSSLYTVRTLKEVAIFISCVEVTSAFTIFVFTGFDNILVLYHDLPRFLSYRELFNSYSGCLGTPACGMRI